MGESAYAWNEQQLEALQEAAEYLNRLIPAAENMAKEFRGELQDDSYELLDMIVEGLNWVIQLFNATKEVINEKGVQIDPVGMDQKINRFASSYTAHNPAGIADGLEEGVLPFLKMMKEVADEA